MTEHPLTIDNPHETPPNGDQPNGLGGWFRGLVAIVTSPRTSFEIIRRNSPWLGVLILLQASTISLALLSSSFGLQMQRAQLTETLPGQPDQVEALIAQTEQVMAAARWIAAGGGAVVTAIVLLVQAVFVWLLAIAFQGRPRFRQALSLMAHVSVIAHLRNWANLGLLHLRDPSAIRSPQDLQVPMGIDLFLAGDNAALNAVWASINPFTIWLLALLGLGAAAVLGLSQRQGLMLAGIYWAATTALTAAATGVASRFIPG